MRKILSLFAAVLFAFAVNAQGTDFAAPGYSCAADDAVLTGGSSSNFYLKTDVTPHYVVWSDVSLSSNAVATWTVTATRGCYVSVALDLGPVISSNKHNFVVKILDSKGNVKGSVTEGGENTASEQVKLLADSILVPAAGTYTVEVINNRDWGKGSIKNVILTYVADAPAEMIPVSSIVINKQSLGLELNEVELLTATVAPDNAFDPSVTWQSSDPTVATVSETGLVAAVAAGTANIIAKAGEKLDTCVVTVAAATVPSTDFTEPFVLSGKKARLEGAVWKNDAYKLYGDGDHNKNYGNAFWTLKVNKRCIVSATLNGVEGGHEFVLDVFNANGDSLTSVKQPAGKTWSAGEIALDTTIAFAAKGEYTFRLRNTQEWSSGKVAGVTLAFVEEMDPTAAVLGTMTDPAWGMEIPFTLAQDKKSATLTVPNIGKGEYQFKMMINGEWRSNGYDYHRGFPAAGGISGNNDNNMKFIADVDGEYSFVWTFANDSLSIIYPAEPIVELDTIYSYYGKRTESASATAAVEKGGTAVAEGGNSNIAVGAAQKTNYTFKLNKGFASGTYYVGITLEKELKAGDQMQLAAFIASDNVAELGIDFSASKEAASTACQLLFSGLQLITTNVAPKDTVLTIPAAAAGAKYIRVYRNSGSTGVYVANLTILRDPNAPEPPAPTEYYLVGSMNNWKSSDTYKFAANPKVDGEYMLNTTLAVGDSLKVMSSKNEWFPDQKPNYIVTADYAGEKTVYFRPAANGGDGWYEGCIYIAPNPKPLTLAEFIALEKDATAPVKDVEVTYVNPNGNNVWLKDETASILMYYANGKIAVKPGDVIKGMEGK